MAEAPEQARIIRAEDFIDKIEIVYAVLLTWGFARVAENFVFRLDYLLPAIISAFVLVRFFFAASHNLKPAVMQSEASASRQNSLFIFDIPILLVHSFVYYRMCFVLADPQHNYIGFYRCFAWLLFFNIVWLFKKELEPSCRKDVAGWCKPWCWNNLAHLVFVIIFIYTREYLLLFWVALSNCLLDFYLTAPDYLGFAHKRHTWLNFMRYYLAPLVVLGLFVYFWPALSSLAHALSS